MRRTSTRDESDARGEREAREDEGNQECDERRRSERGLPTGEPSMNHDSERHRCDDDQTTGTLHE